MSTAGERTKDHPRHRLDTIIHSPVRLSVMACLAACDKAEFKYVRDLVEVTDAHLSKEVATLYECGYVEVTKGYVGKRPRTWLALSQPGRRALAEHLEALAAIAHTPGIAAQI
ncbi:winged helix-turn-helix domain-containing protein [Nocardia sp. CA-135398]|uniref:winged helix-turn-helix domain-containing protein n=1 Tax=Nocardia sp. CA-135398 TaxID=3239977 RepID=UPI003D99610A